MKISVSLALVLLVAVMSFVSVAEAAGKSKLGKACSADAFCGAGLTCQKFGNNRVKRCLSNTCLR